MRLTVLVPSEEYRNYAGARIRYGRLAPELERLGIHLSLADVASFDAANDGSDALLISKCHDAQALVAAAAGQERGQLVGVDLFDDYFSQRADSRLSRFRTWLSQLLQNCHFALCSTRLMSEVIETYHPGLPTQIINDPEPVVDVEEVGRLLRTKLETARSQERVGIAWFGVGDNPHFRVGLHDLAAYAGTLRSLTDNGFELELTVLTNARALTAEGLALVAALPVCTHVAEWTESGERELLARSFACFLPVSAQPFSAAKSLNRAVTALSAGCQVVSAGYPLYEDLGNLIYRDVDEFVGDLARGTMKHSQTNVLKYRNAMEASASAAREAEGVAKFLQSLARPAASTKRPIVLVQGQSPNGLAHKAVKALKGLSVASPYCATGLGFDVVFRGGAGALGMYVSDRAAERLMRDVRERLAISTIISERRFWYVPAADQMADRASDEEEWHNAPLPFQIAGYGHAMAKIRERMQTEFGPCRMLISENSQLPFSAEF
jgi:hypothetical protein